MTNMEMLLDELKGTELEVPQLNEFERYLVPIDDKSVWKYRKQYAIVNEFYLIKFELWKDRLIERIFYINQYWENKIKHYYDVFEVQRFLAGSRYKLNRGIYQPSFAGCARPIFWKDYKKCNWERNNIDTIRCDYQSYCYHRSIDVLFINSYQPLLKNSVHKYSGFEFSGLNDDELFWFLYQYEKHPQMEMIAKMGLIQTIKGSMNCIRWSQKGYKLLGLENKKELELVTICNSFGGLKYYRKHKDDIKKLKINDEHELFIYDVLQNRHFSNITRKVIEYISNEDKKIGYVYSHLSSASNYIDYIGFCNNLGIPLTSAIKYPNDLKKAHDELQDKIKIKVSKTETQKIQKQVIEKLYKFRYASEEFIITPANSVEDLINESKELNHCVRTYVNRYANGDTSIFLIRKRDDVMMPFYTLELKNKKVHQVRGKHNCDPTDDVRNFVVAWCKKHKLDSKIYQKY